ncbi:MAG TPA: hypothetical protein VK858_00625 [Longimicrobiales bacterium]|nr:hypothetical protein [Longimicrobiales bacterium]
MVLPATLQSTVSGAPARDTLSIVADLSMIVMALAVAFAVVFLVIQLHKVGSYLREFRTRAEGRTAPLLDRSRSIAANVEYISATLRADVEHVNGSVRALSDRLQQASDRMEERIEEFNALMEVVQGEAESAFIGTASTVRGIRAGAERLRDGGAAEDEAKVDRAREVHAPDALGTLGEDPSSERSA